MKSKKIIIGSRGSKLALIYAEKAKAEIIKSSKEFDVEIKKITTKGDIIQDVRLSDTGGSALIAVEKLRDAGYVVEKIITVVDRQVDGEADAKMKEWG